MPSIRTYLGVGGNIGDVQSAITQVFHAIQSDPGTRNVIASPVYKTSPWGMTDQPDFLNLVISFDWTKDIQELLSWINTLEAEAGRSRDPSCKWGPRTIDIDILLFGEEIINTASVTIPHARMHKRNFVLVPLSDLAPDLIPPGWSVTILKALEQCEDDGEVERFDDLKLV